MNVTYLLHFPYGAPSDVPIGVVNNQDDARALADMINLGRTGTEAPEVVVLEIPVINLKF